MLVFVCLLVYEFILIDNFLLWMTCKVILWSLRLTVTKKAFLCYLLYRRQMPTIVVFWGSEHAFGGTCGPGEHVSGPVHPPQSDMRETSSSAEGRWELVGRVSPGSRVKWGQRWFFDRVQLAMNWPLATIDPGGGFSAHDKWQQQIMCRQNARCIRCRALFTDKARDCAFTR